MLDETLKRWQRRLESLLRLGGSRQGASGLMLILLLAGVAVWLATGLFQVGASERAVVERFGKLIEVRGPGRGWHWPWPIESVTTVDVMGVRSKPLTARVLTVDMNLLEVRLAVQYRLADPLKVLFQLREPEETLQQLTNMAVRELIGRRGLDDALAAGARPQLTEQLCSQVQSGLDRYDSGIAVTSINIADVLVPEPVQAAQRDAQDKAPVDAEHAIKEAQAYASGLIPQAQAYAAKVREENEAYRTRVLALAEGQAALFTEVAQAYARAPAVTRERLYLETLEDIYGRSNKVFVESKPGSGGNIIYLPLDKLLPGHTAANAPATAEPQPAENANRAPNESETVTVEGRGRGER